MSHADEISTGKRAIAAVLSLVQPGTGQYLLGSPKRAAVWIAMQYLGVASMVAATLVGSFAAFAASVAVSIAVFPASAIAAFRTRVADSRVWWKVALLWVGLLILGVPVRLAVRTHLTEAYKIPSAGMSPTFGVGDHVMVSKLRTNPGRGEVIVFRRSEPRADYLKRVVGLAGDRVEVRGGELAVSGAPVSRRRIDEPCANEPECELWEERLDGHTYRTSLRTDRFVDGETQVFHVPPDHVFVMGDARNNSFDSRMFGAVPLASVLGTVQFAWLKGG